MRTWGERARWWFVAWILVTSACAFSIEPQKLRLRTLRPTQFSFGAYEVALKRAKLDRISSDDGGLGEYKREHPALVVLGPGHVPYLVDGHHLARALVERGSKWMYAIVHADWSHLSEAEFARRMQTERLCYLRDRGVVRSWEQLPKSLEHMSDDPYRTLAWLVREAGGYRRLDVPFQEFAWTEFFRTRVAISGKPDWRALTNEGVELAISEEASELPGWGSESCAALLAN